MNWKKNLTLLGLAILIDGIIIWLFEPKPPLIGGPTTFPRNLLWRLGFGIQPDLTPILAVFFWFVVLTVGWWVVKWAKRNL